MSELGRHLKEARLQKGMSLDDVQEVTKIRKKYLEAIETGDYKVLPGDFYVRAFIKTYAEAVGVNPDELMQEHGNVAVTPKEPTMESVIQKRSRRPETERNAKWLPTLLMWTFPVLIIVVIYMYAIKSGSDGNQTVDPTKVTDATQDPKTAQTSSPAPGGGVAQPTASPTTGNDGDSVQTTPEPSPSLSPSPESITVGAGRKSGKTTIFDVSASAGSPVEVIISATGVSWLEVYKGGNSTGEKLSYGNTAAGDNMVFTLGSEGIYIKSGNSRATVITVNGQTVTDGKSTSRILFELADGTAGTTDGTGATEGTQGSEGSEPTATEESITSE
ncbi:helix-turn-helix domain-containing protein [Paenibacillus wynnii]|uniref:helix-turn-helix domain-containing protein n=1 Tax=Paenibacillus wynnii TaxID=268407 RepID=UPI00279169FC|nr:RodZ domain-containing protein [Paenibacillus wynnii]MDQ0193421.1 cytoskeletal protein RodZ [Paenibacillus wynnii]